MQMPVWVGGATMVGEGAHTGFSAVFSNPEFLIHFPRLWRPHPHPTQGL